jgi:pyruvate,water dikinase
MVLKMVVDFDPAPEERHQKIRLGELAGYKQLGIFFKLFYHRAREFRLLREQVSMLYTYGYGLFRYYYLALGEQFVNRGILEHKDDIFYLTKQQVQDLAENLSPKDLHGIIEQHKADIKRYENIPLPTVIYGDETPPISDGSQDTLIGVPASIGYYTGSVRIVTGIHDFSKVKDGDVLVIPYSEVSWSPLFARAGAVVAESGGLLSHSSIIAREYGIPAVVSANGAMKLRDNMCVSVDGQKGIVIIHSPS